MQHNPCDVKCYESNVNSDLLDLLPNKPGTAIDIGCGSGVNAKVLSACGWIVDGITASPAEAEDAADCMREVWVHDLEKGLPDDLSCNYDAVIMSHVLEHIAYPERLLEDVKGILSNGGIVYVALPNLMHYKSRLQLMLGNFPYKEDGIWDYTHLRWYTFKSAQHLLRNRGYDVCHSGASGALPFGRILNALFPNKFLRILSRVLSRISPGMFGGQLLFVARIGPNERRRVT